MRRKDEHLVQTSRDECHCTFPMRGTVMASTGNTITLVHFRCRKNTRCRSWNLPVIGMGEPNMAARLRRCSGPLLQETYRKRWMVCSVTVGCPAADIRGRIEDFSLGWSGPTSVAAPATVARFGDSTATITKPIPSRGEGIEP